MAKYVSDRTKQCKILTTIFGVLHFLCLFGPLLYFVPYGYATGAVVEKIAMSFTVSCCDTLACINLTASLKRDVFGVEIECAVLPLSARDNNS